MAKEIGEEKVRPAGYLCKRVMVVEFDRHVEIVALAAFKYRRRQEGYRQGYRKGVNVDSFKA